MRLTLLAWQPPSEEIATDKVDVVNESTPLWVVARSVIPKQFHGDAFDAVGATLHDARRIEGDNLYTSALQGTNRLLGPRIHDDFPWLQHQKIGGITVLLFIGRDLYQLVTVIFEKTVGVPGKTAGIDDT